MFVLRAHPGSDDLGTGIPQKEPVYICPDCVRLAYQMLEGPPLYDRVSRTSRRRTDQVTDPRRVWRWPDGATMVHHRPRHRGGTGPWRENTLEAFAGALRLGGDGVELDVRRTSDGRLVVLHDAEIAGTGAVHDLRAKELPPWVRGSMRRSRPVPERRSTWRSRTHPWSRVRPDRDGGHRGWWPHWRRRPAGTRACPGASQRVVVWRGQPGGRPGSGARGVDRIARPPLARLFPAAEQAAALGCVALHPFHSHATPALSIVSTAWL